MELPDLQAREEYWSRKAQQEGYLALKPSHFEASSEEVQGANRSVIATFEEILQQAYSERKWPPSVPMLEVGSGFGGTGVPLAQHTRLSRRGKRLPVFTNITGVDFSSVMLHRAREFARAMRVSRRVRFKYGVATNLVGEEFAPESFGAVIFSRVLIHIVDHVEWREVLRQSYELLCFGGVLVIGEPMVNGNPRYSSLLAGMKHKFTRIRSAAHYHRVLKELGFQMKSLEKCSFLDEVYSFLVYTKPY